MWMLETGNVVYTDPSDKSYQVKDIKYLETYENTFEIGVPDDSLLDEICISRQVYGPNSEDSSYLLFEANAVKIAENNFSLTNIQTLRCPVGE